jgi:hypothetical protein
MRASNSAVLLRRRLPSLAAGFGLSSAIGLVAKPSA